MEYSPIEAIKFTLEQRRLKRSDLIPYIDLSSKVSEVLSGKRALNKKMIIALHEGFGISANLLIGSSVHTKKRCRINVV